jgi:hypothetical protein
MLNVLMLSAVMLNVDMLSVVMPNVVAPPWLTFEIITKFKGKNEFFTPKIIYTINFNLTVTCPLASMNK